MENRNQLFYQNIIHNMSSGLLILDFDGHVNYINPPAEKLLGLTAQQLEVGNFVHHFIDYDENDDFIQLILDAVYEKNQLQESIVPFRNDQCSYTVRMKTSYLEIGGECMGVICMMDDITELYELKDAVKAMNEIKRLNESLTLRNSLLKETFGRFLSDDIVKQLLDTENGLAMGGKRQELTIMMSDLRGFTALSERMNPTDMIRMLNHYLAEMTEVIQKHNGTIIEFIGDGILAIFGAPIYHESHATDAVAAAVEMQSAMVRVNEWNESEGFEHLAMGIGIHTGDVTVGNIGSEKRTKYGVVGRNVNLTGRVESYTTEGQVLISPDTRSRVSLPLRVAAEMEVLPKGLKKPIILSRVTGIGDLSCAGIVHEEEPEMLSVPGIVHYTKLNGKAESVELLEGTIVACSKTMLLMDSTDLSVYDNLCLKIGGNLYCKVVDHRSNRYTLRITAQPAEYESWKAGLLKGTAVNHE